MAPLPIRVNPRLLKQLSFLPCLGKWAKNYGLEAHVPSIRFRYGKRGGKLVGRAAKLASAPSPRQRVVKAASRIASASTAIEDWELPMRYQRKRMDQVEINYINTGGPP